MLLIDWAMHHNDGIRATALNHSCFEYMSPAERDVMTGQTD